MNRLVFTPACLALSLLATQAAAGHSSRSTSAATSHPTPAAPLTTTTASKASKTPANGPQAVSHAAQAKDFHASSLVASPSPTPDAPALAEAPAGSPGPVPTAPPGAIADDGMVDVVFESRQDHVQLQVQNGPLYDKVCEAPCKARVPVGTVLGLRHDGNTTLALGSKPVLLTQPVHIVGTYVDRTPVRISGAVIAAAGFAGGMALIANSGMTPACFSGDTGGDSTCQTTNGHPKPVEGLIGYATMIVGMSAGFVMLIVPNLARFEITPLQTTAPAAATAFKAEAGVLQRASAQAEGIGLRLRF